MRRFLLFAALLISFKARLFGWGPEGHRIVAQIAQNHLSDVAAQSIHSLLDGETLASIANWADDVRRERDETYDWHFVNIPKDAPRFDEGRDCYRPDDPHKGAHTDHHNCVVDRIDMFRQSLDDEKLSLKERTEALKFLVHFVGDVHQPFHAIAEARNGNGIRVTEFGFRQCERYPCNLHATWDDGLVRHTGMNEHQYVAHLEEVIKQENLGATRGPRGWANESHDLAKQALVSDGSSIDQIYYNREIKIVDERLALAGLRLAALLNSAFHWSLS